MNSVSFKAPVMHTALLVQIGKLKRLHKGYCPCQGQDNLKLTFYPLKNNLLLGRE